MQEFAFKYRGLSIQQEYHQKKITDKVGNDRFGPNSKFDLEGYYVQSGYFFHNVWKSFPEKLELAARYAYVKEPNAGLRDGTTDEPDANTVANPDLDNKRREAILAANYFFKGHRNKLTLDYSYLTLDNGLVSSDSYEDRVRLQWDVSF